MSLPVPLSALESLVLATSTSDAVHQLNREAAFAADGADSARRRIAGLLGIDFPSNAPGVFSSNSSDASRDVPSDAPGNSPSVLLPSAESVAFVAALRQNTKKLADFATVSFDPNFDFSLPQNKKPTHSNNEQKHSLDFNKEADEIIRLVVANPSKLIHKLELLHALPLLAHAFLTSKDSSKLPLDQRIASLNVFLNAPLAHLLHNGTDLLPQILDQFCLLQNATSAPSVVPLMTLQQLDALALFRPTHYWSSLWFVEAYIMKKYLLRCHASIENKAVEIDALVEVDQFLQTDARVCGNIPAFVPLKNSFVLKLLQTKLGKLKIFDVELFERYIRMPGLFSTEQLWIESPTAKNSPSQPPSLFDRWKVSPSLEVRLVRLFLSHIFQTQPAKSMDAYTALIHPEVVKSMFARVKIEQGGSEGAKWHHLLPPPQLHSLLQETTLAFSPTHPLPKYLLPSNNTPTPPLVLSIKNIPTLEINEYEINTFAMHKSGVLASSSESAAGVLMGLDLSGVVPHRSRVWKVGGGEAFVAGKVYVEKVGVEWLDGVERGVVVVDVVGGGKRCRAVLRKGLLRVVEQITTAGHVFSVVDERNAPIESEFDVWMAGHVFKPTPNGTFTIPFTRSTKPETLLITHKNHTSPAVFQHCEESYTLSTQWLLNRESVRSGNTVRVAVIPLVSVTSRNVGVSLREVGVDRVSVSVTVVQEDGVENGKVVEVEVVEGRECVFEVGVVGKVKRLEFKLSVKVRNVSKKEEVVLEDTKVIQVNGMDETLGIEGTFLRKSGEEGFELLVLGKNGEPRKQFSTEVFFKHRLVVALFSRILCTNDFGCIPLGTLPGITGVGVAMGDAPAKCWEIAGVSVLNPMNLVSKLGSGVGDRSHLVIEEGEKFVVPVPVSAGGMEACPHVWDLVQRDVENNMALSSFRHLVRFSETGKNSCDLVITAGLNPGSYELKLFDSLVTITVRPASFLVSPSQSTKPTTSHLRETITASTPFHLSLYRQTQSPKLHPSRIQHATAHPGGLTLTLRNASHTTRVHCIVNLFQSPESSSSDEFGAANATNGDVEDVKVDPETVLACGYSVPQELNADLEYVLKRGREGVGKVGNTLEKPSFLLDSWKTRGTSLLDDSLDGTVQNQRMRESTGPGGGGGYAAHPMMACAAAPMRGGFGATGGMGKMRKMRMAPARPRLQTLSKLKFDDSNYDFLSKNGASLFNLKPSEDGTLFVPLTETCQCEILFIVVDGTADHTFTTFKHQMNGSPDLPLTDTAIRPSWPITSTTTEVLSATALKLGQTLSISTASDFAVISDLSQLFSLAESLSRDAEAKQMLSKFRFITSWNTLPRSMQTALWSEYSCHEMNLFLRFHDPAFFETVVKPHLRSKSCFSVMDWVLLEDVDACCRVVRDVGG
ncbi:hypothetical protein HDU98_012086, partial [Podochytrium sp. JEL0797]